MQCNAALKIDEPEWPLITEWVSDCCNAHCHAGFDSRDGYFKAFCPVCGVQTAPALDTIGMIKGGNGR